jgi:hypothetical protein
LAASGDHVIGVFAREALSAALATTHRAGFGPQARAIDGARGDALRQLQRMGLRTSWDPSVATDAVLIVVNAPGRTQTVSDLFWRAGAEHVAVADRERTERPVGDAVISLSPDIRIGDGAGAESDG